MEEEKVLDEKGLEEEDQVVTLAVICRMKPLNYRRFLL